MTELGGHGRWVDNVTIRGASLLGRGQIFRGGGRTLEDTMEGMRYDRVSKEHFCGKILQKMCTES